jgi:hypothetical protein
VDEGVWGFSAQEGIRKMKNGRRKIKKENNDR